MIGGVGINGGLENSQKFNSRVGIEENLFDKLKPNTKKLKCFRLLSLFKNNTFLNQMHSFRH